jgi:hypothetical protein
MPNHDDTRQSQQPRSWLARTMPLAKMLLAILAGNVLYYILMPHLSEFWQHKIFQIDAGLGLDFLLCVAMYGVVRLIFR